MAHEARFPARSQAQPSPPGQAFPVERRTEKTWTCQVGAYAGLGLARATEHIYGFAASYHIAGPSG